MMEILEFEITPEVVERFPQITVYAMRAVGVAQALAGSDSGAILGRASRALLEGKEDVAKHPVIVAWRAAYAEMGVKPSRYRSSIEALARRAAKGGELQLRIPAVDLYNACSLEAFAPLGAYDLARLPTAPIQLRTVRAGDEFTPLGADSSAFPLSPGLVVYASENLILCWGFNVRDSQIAALTPLSEDVVFLSEAVAPEQRQLSLRALEILRENLSRCGAVCSATIEASPGAPKFKLGCCFSGHATHA